MFEHKMFHLFGLLRLCRWVGLVDVEALTHLKLVTNLVDVPAKSVMDL